MGQSTIIIFSQFLHEVINYNNKLQSDWTLAWRHQFTKRGSVGLWN